MSERRRAIVIGCGKIAGGYNRDPDDAMARLRQRPEHTSRATTKLENGVADDVGKLQVELDVVAQVRVIEVVVVRQSRVSVARCVSAGRHRKPIGAQHR